VLLFQFSKMVSRRRLSLSVQTPPPQVVWRNAQLSAALPRAEPSRRLSGIVTVKVIRTPPCHNLARLGVAQPRSFLADRKEEFRQSL